METISYGVFETNSSSTHALTSGRKLNEEYVPAASKLKIRWIDTDDESVLNTLKDKVSYLVSHIANWYKYDVNTYEELLEEIRNDSDFQEIENYVLQTFGKQIIFPEYKGECVEDVVNINHQLTSWNHNLKEILEDLIDKEERNYLAEVLEDGKDIEFGRD